MRNMLTWTTLFGLIFCFAASSAFRVMGDGGKLHALLVAGSNGWYNYRHQADVAHAYHVLLGKGVPAENIIVMMYDDIAHHKSNPHPGKLFNSPTGRDVYSGLRIDYKGDAVNPRNFLAVLKGDRSSVRGGNGRVIHSSAEDRIFVYFTDHGSTGLICFPNEVLTAKQLNDALLAMRSKNRFSELVFYLETCESGSMFNGVLRTDIGVFAVTAANPYESSYALYCNNNLNLPCLGDLFSVSWMEDTEKNDINKETLLEQFKKVKQLTTLSHVMKYGNLSMAGELVGRFQGGGRSHSQPWIQMLNTQSNMVSWSSRDVELMELMKSSDGKERAAELAKRRADIRDVFTGLVDHLVEEPAEKERILEQRTDITNLDCHDDVVRMFDLICIDVNKHNDALRHMNVLNNLCMKFGDSAKILKGMWETCQNTRSKFF